MRLVLPLTSLALLYGPAAAQGEQITTPRVERIAIVEYGIYDAGPGRKIIDPGQPSGVREEVNDLRLVRSTNIVPGDLESAFGIIYEVAGLPNGAPAQVTEITRFPAQGLRNPKTGKTVTVTQTKRNVTIGQSYATGYSFAYPWEIVPGDWTFEVWYGGKKMTEKKFTVIP